MFKADKTKSGRDRYLMDGKPMTGVTTILGMHAKPFLIDWAAKEAYKDALTKTKEEIQEILETKSWAHTKKGDKAKNTGTDVHQWLDQWVLSEINPTYPLQPSPDEIKHVVDRVVDWAVEKNVKFLKGDESVYSTKYWYAGSFDFVCEIDGKKYLGDFKTSGKIDEEYYWQCAAYVNALKEMGEDVDGYIIVRTDKMEKAIYPDQTLFDVAYRFVSEHFKDDFACFLACKTLYSKKEQNEE